MHDKPRPGQKPKLTGEGEAQLTVLASSDPPEGHARWTMRLLADKLVELEVLESIGSLTIFLTVEPLRGWRKVRVTERRTSGDLAEELRRLVDEDYPEAEVIVLVTDNLNPHSPACLYEAFSPAEAHRIATKLEWHYTSEHGFWLNVAECELSVLARQCGLARRIPDQATLMAEVTAWERKRNAAQTTKRTVNIPN